MSVKHGLLALLERGSRYGYQLRAEFEQATGGTWPLNIGQVYTTLSRLERDGLVRSAAGIGRGPATVRDHRRWPDGADAVVRHADQPGRPAARRTRDQAGAGADDTRRRRARGRADAAHGDDADAAGVHPPQDRRRRPGDLAWRLVLDAMVFRAEAEVRWLDHCESSLVRFADAALGQSPATAADDHVGAGRHWPRRHADRRPDADERPGAARRPPHPRQAARPPYTRCAASTWPSRPASSSPSWDRPARASPHCSTSPAGSTRRRRVRWSSRGRCSAGSTASSWPRCAGARSATSSRTSTSCPASPPPRTSRCRWSWTG